jgi:hypothetical protein
MSLTPEITVQVSPEIAAAYQQTTATERAQINSQIMLLLKSATMSPTEAITQLRQTMDHLSAEAEANGLTPEILESILHEPG